MLSSFKLTSTGHQLSLFMSSEHCNKHVIRLHRMFVSKRVEFVFYSLGDLLQSVASHPEYKMLTVRTIPHVSKRSAEFSSFQWPGLLKHLRQMLVANAAIEEGKISGTI